MTAPSPPSRARLRWQCRRGMRELDVLLSAWLEQRFDGASERQKAAFERLLALPDPELAGYLLQGKTVADPELGDVIQQLRGHRST